MLYVSLLVLLCQGFGYLMILAVAFFKIEISFFLIGILLGYKFVYLNSCLCYLLSADAYSKG